MATQETGHLRDGDLVRLLDGEVEAGEAAVAAHVAACAACAARLEKLRRRSARLTELLDASWPAPVDARRLRPPRRSLWPRAVWARPTLRAAAAILILAGLAAATPARAWILERVARWRASVDREATPRVSPATKSQAPPGPASTVLFGPAGDELVISFEARQASGTLEVSAGDNPRASAQIVAGGRGETLLVLPTELRVRNASNSVADYRVVLPLRVRRVRVVVGNETSQAVTFGVTSGMRRVLAVGH